MPAKYVRRIGLTMREVTDPTTGEVRDALAKDWRRFLAAALPDVAWCPIPNIGDDVVRYVEAWGLEGLILTGGDDVGDVSPRDRTERTLLAHCFTAHLPVLGVCRGMQRIWKELGGHLRPIDGHAGTSHAVTLNNLTGPAMGTLTVNSFHRFGLDSAHVPSSLRCIGYADDGSIEAVLAEAPRLLGLMWHPERNIEPQDSDIAWVRWLFGHD